MDEQERDLISLAMDYQFNDFCLFGYNFDDSTVENHKGKNYVILRGMIHDFYCVYLVEGDTVLNSVLAFKEYPEPLQKEFLNRKNLKTNYLRGTT